MDIQNVIETGKTQQLPIDQLRTLAGNPAAFGADVVELFAGQAERRAVAAGDVLKTAETESRDLLASENRQYEKTMREAEQVRALQAHVEARTAAKGFVPASATSTAFPLPAPAAPSAVLGTDQRMAGWLQKRGGYSYQSDQGAEAMRLGAIIAAMASGNRSHLSDLEKRALSEGTDSAGGFTVPEIISSRFIDRVRDQLVIMKAGAVTVPMTSDTLHLARLKQPGLFEAATPTVNSAVAGWKTENAAIVDSDLVLERVTLTARTLPLILKMSVELFEDSPNISEIVEQEMAASTALELDRVALVGTGTPPEPKGILFQTGILTGVLGVTWANWDEMIDAAAQLWAVNHEPNAAIYGTTKAVQIAKLKSTADAQPLTMPSALSGIRQYRSSAAGPRVFLGDFTQLLVGMRTSFRVEVSRTAGDAFQNLQVAVRSYMRADIAVAHANAFNVLTLA